MIHEKWFISDTHFYHANILKFTGDDEKRIRPFNSLAEMHETFIKNWNSVVGVNDYVYHLGDVTFQYHRGFSELMHSLKGRKRLLLGNHDKIKGTNLIDFFEKVDLWKSFKEFNFTASHMPLKEGHFRNGEFNLHGHMHQNVVLNSDRKTPNLKYKNISVELTNWAPVHIDTIIEELNERSKQFNS